jgi:hypothetical protein
VQEAAAAAASSSSSGAQQPPQAADGGVAAAGAPAQAAAPSSRSSSSSSVSTSDIIELDFCSRPLLDERGKKVWELLVCSPDRSFEFSQYFPNNKINSAEVGAVWGWRVVL